MKMNKRIKKLWVDALRSGEYKQAKSKLRKGSYFCCLGVLCNIHAQEHPEIAAKQLSSNFYMGNSDLLPPAVIKWAKLQSVDGGCVKVNGISHSLTVLNDSGKANFDKLADLIEEQL